MFIAFIVTSALSGYIVLLPILLIFHYCLAKRIKSLGDKENLSHILVSYIFCFYLFSVLVLTGVPSIYQFRFDPNINMLPIVGVFSYPQQYILNIFLFVPLGFLLSLLWGKCRRFFATVSIGFLFSLAIEAMQLFCYRATDIDDLITNTLGTVVGYVLHLVINRVLPRISSCQRRDTRFDYKEMAFYIGVVWGIMFLVQPIILTTVEKYM